MKFFSAWRQAADGTMERKAREAWEYAARAMIVRLCNRCLTCTQLALREEQCRKGGSSRSGVSSKIWMALVDAAVTLRIVRACWLFAACPCGGIGRRVGL